MKLTCRKCGGLFDPSGKRGRPAVLCKVCKGEVITNISGLVNIPARPAIPMSNPPIIVRMEEDTKESSPTSPVVVKKEKLDTTIKVVFEVIVTNMGFAYRGDVESEAKKVFKSYSNKSARGFGQVGHEKVFLRREGELVEEFDPFKEYENAELEEVEINSA